MMVQVIILIGIINNWARDNIDSTFNLFGFADDVDDDIELGEEDAKVIVLPSLVNFVMVI